MKLRIKGNSIRIRLSRSEIEHFGKEGYLEEQTKFKKEIFIYALRSVPDGNELSSDFSGNKITVYVPSQMALEWTTTDNIGYNNIMELGDGKQLFILIEKDFKCID